MKVSFWKLIISALVLIFAILFSFPTILPSLSSKIWSDAPKVNLGLDLRGGASLLLEMDFDSYLNERQQKTIDEIRVIARSEKIALHDVVSGKDGIVVHPKDPAKTKDLLAKLKSELKSTYNVFNNNGSINKWT
jgi:preprotein translocase subunit SecD